jgi:hypothetical protein
MKKINPMKYSLTLAGKNEKLMVTFILNRIRTSQTKLR